MDKLQEKTNYNVIKPKLKQQYVDKVQKDIVPHVASDEDNACMALL